MAIKMIIYGDPYLNATGTIHKTHASHVDLYEFNFYGHFPFEFLWPFNLKEHFKLENG